MAGLAVVSYDLDSTLCNTMHRRHLINADRSKTDWMAYSMACGDDALGPAFPMLYADHPFIVVSRRFTEAKELTLKWLADRGFVPEAAIMLKDEFPDSHELSHAQWKLNAISWYEYTTANVVLYHVDDKQEVTNLLEKSAYAGVTVCGNDPSE